MLSHEHAKECNDRDPIGLNFIHEPLQSKKAYFTVDQMYLLEGF